MVYGAGLSVFVKKAFKENGRQTNMKDLAKSIILDPQISAVDVAVLSPKDISGLFNRKEIMQALEHKHPDVKVIYIYFKESEMLDVKGIKQIQCKRITDDFVLKAVQEVLAGSAIKSREVSIISRDSQVMEMEKTSQEVEKSIAMHKELDETRKIDSAELEDQLTLDIPNIDVIEPKGIEGEKVPTEKTREDRIKEATYYNNWDFIKDSLEKETLMQELLEESSKYAGTIDTLEILEKQIWAAFTDSSLPYEEKFARIKKIGLEKSSIQATKNDIIAQKAISIINSIVSSASDIVNRKIDDIRKGYELVAQKDIYHKDQQEILGLFNQRLETQTELVIMAKEVIETYSLMDKSITDVINDLDENLPSRNGMINEVMSPILSIFTPANTSNIVNKLLTSLQSGLIPMSALEEKVKGTIQLVFKLCEDQQNTIDHLQKLTEIMQVQRLEDIVIIRDIIQNSLRLYIGESETGRTATVLTWSGILSRRDNVLVIDLTGNSKISQYGMDTILLHDFLNTRVEKKLCCVTGRVDNILDLDDIVKELKNRLSYYSYINIILDPSQIDIIQELAKFSISCSFISDCKPSNINKVKVAVNAVNKLENIARKVILIDPPIESHILLDSLGVELTTAKLIVLPNVKYIKACSLTNSKPWESDEVLNLFEVAFK